MKIFGKNLAVFEFLFIEGCLLFGKLNIIIAVFFTCFSSCYEYYIQGIYL